MKCAKCGRLAESWKVYGGYVRGRPTATIFTKCPVCGSQKVHE